MPRHCWGQPTRPNTSGFQDMSIGKLEILQNCPLRVSTLGKGKMSPFLGLSASMSAWKARHWTIDVRHNYLTPRRHLWSTGPWMLFEAGCFPPEFPSQPGSSQSFTSFWALVGIRFLSRLLIQSQGKKSVNRNYLFLSPSYWNRLPLPSYIS